jgi:hypothetical protein
MPAWATATLGYCIYVAACAALVPRLSWRARARALATSFVAASLAVSAQFAGGFLVHSLLFPLASLLLGYRATGFLWRTHDVRFERPLATADAALGILARSGRTPRWVAECLELAYAAVYPLIPIAFWLYLRFAPAPDADRFWTVVLVTDYACFSLLPWIQTRPPRSVEGRAPWRASLRRLNLGILDAASIQMNTVPSGHAAEAFACALLLAGSPSDVLVPMAVMSAAVSAGAVFGRYHYAIDIVLGWMVALLVWAVVRP